MKDMKFINPKTFNNNNEYVPTLNNCLWTLEGTELLFKKSNSRYNVSSVWLQHLNQGPIENLFLVNKKSRMPQRKPYTRKVWSSIYYIAGE